MASFKAKKVERALLSKGFHHEPKDHNVFVFYYNGARTSVRTKTSHGRRDIKDELISSMKKQLHLNKEEFCDFINYPLDEKNYISILKKKNII
jgi:predicted RNA binding protein YcfA (HicA-like mRNA interferase family)